MIKAGIFDVGNVLIKWNSQPMYDDINTTLGITDIQRHKAFSLFEDQFEVGAMSEAEFWKSFIAEVNPSKPLPDRSLFVTEFAKRFTINQPVLDIALKMGENGYRIAILSNAIDPHVNFIKTTGLYDNFNEVVLSNEVGCRKPEREIYELTIERLGIKSEEALFVDDLPQNVEGANEVGIHGILFQDPERLRTSLIGLGVDL